MKTNSVKRLTISALLIAMGIIIPMVMPKLPLVQPVYISKSRPSFYCHVYFSSGGNCG